MFDTTSDGIMKLAAQGESQFVEFKEKLPLSDSIGKVLASFANVSGGILLIGIRDNGEISGITSDDMYEAIHRIKSVSNSLFPWAIEVNSVDIRGKIVVYAVINKSPKEYYPIMSANGEIYKRKDQRIVKIIRHKRESILKADLSAVTKGQRRIKIFVAMSFRDEEEPSLIDYYKAMERAVNITKLPIDIYRIDLVEGDYEISQKIMDEIDNSDVVITDFTLNTRNVYFELGYARGKGRKIIQTARKNTALEFDVRNWRTIFYRNATELEEKIITEIKSKYAEIVK